MLWMWSITCITGVLLATSFRIFRLCRSFHIASKKTCRERDKVNYLKSWFFFILFSFSTTWFTTNFCAILLFFCVCLWRWWCVRSVLFFRTTIATPFNVKIWTESRKRSEKKHRLCIFIVLVDLHFMFIVHNNHFAEYNIIILFHNVCHNFAVISVLSYFLCLESNTTKKTKEKKKKFIHTQTHHTILKIIYGNITHKI